MEATRTAFLSMMCATALLSVYLVIWKT